MGGGGVGRRDGWGRRRRKEEGGVEGEGGGGEEAKGEEEEEEEEVPNGIETPGDEVGNVLSIERQLRIPIHLIGDIRRHFIPNDDKREVKKEVERRGRLTGRRRWRKGRKGRKRGYGRSRQEKSQRDTI